MTAGDTFLIFDRSYGTPPHLWIVISDTDEDPERALIVNFTSARHYKDDSCVVDTRDHPFFTKDSVVAYNHSRLVPVAKLNRLVDLGLIERKDPAGPELLAKVRAGAAVSPNLIVAHRALLESQGLI